MSQCAAFVIRRRKNSVEMLFCVKKHMEDSRRFKWAMILTLKFQFYNWRCTLIIQCYCKSLNINKVEFIKSSLTIFILWWKLEQPYTVYHAVSSCRERGNWNKNDFQCKFSKISTTIPWAAILLNLNSE